jgi:hypothetical protein
MRTRAQYHQRRMFCDTVSRDTNVVLCFFVGLDDNNNKEH